MIEFIFSKRLKELRKSAGLTQQELGVILNLTKASICNYERGTRMASLETLIEMSIFFNIDINYLIGTEIILINNKKTIARVSYSEYKIIEEIRKNCKLYEVFISTPSRIINRINKILF